VHEIDVEADQGVAAAEVLAPQQGQQQVVVGLPGGGAAPAGDGRLGAVEQPADEAAAVERRVQGDRVDLDDRPVLVSPR
jgi:hypothetical protein